MEIHASSTYDLDTIRALCHLQSFGKRNPIKMILFYGIIDFILISFAIAELIYFGFSIGVFLALCAVTLSYLSMIYRYFFFPSVHFKNLQALQNQQNAFIFREYDFLSTSANENHTSNGCMQYDAIYKVMETSRYLFIGQTKNTVYIIDKSTIQNGSIDDIRNLLSSYSSFKYIICNY